MVAEVALEHVFLQEFQFLHQCPFHNFNLVLVLLEVKAVEGWEPSKHCSFGYREIVEGKDV
jgi:hypothetical protein